MARRAGTTAGTIGNISNVAAPTRTATTTATKGAIGGGAPTTKTAPTMRTNVTGAITPIKPTSQGTVDRTSLPTSHSLYQSGGAIGGGGVGVADPEAAAPPMPDPEQWLAGDKPFQLQLSALLEALKLYGDDFNQKNSLYDTDFTTGARKLGWQDTDNNFDNNDLNGDGKLDEQERAGAGKFLWDDTTTAAGSGRKNQVNDFAARGMLRSTDFARAQEDLQRELGDQFSSMFGARHGYKQDLLSQKTAFESENQNAQKMARQEALERMAMSQKI